MNPMYAKFMALSFELVGLVIVLCYIGKYLDEKMGWPGYGIAGGGLIALISWLYHLYLVMKQMEKDEPK